MIEFNGVCASQCPIGGPATPALGMTISTVSFGEKAMAALNSWTTASHDVTSVFTNLTLSDETHVSNHRFLSFFPHFFSP